MSLRKEWNKLLQDEKKIYIYGAGKYGKKLFRQLRQDGKNENVCGFLVSDKTENPETVEDIKVLQVSELQEKDGLVLISVSDQYQDEIIKTLEKFQFTNYVNAYKFAFLENEDKSAVEVVEIYEFFQRQYQDGRFCRFDIIIRLLAAEEYFEENTFGIALYRKMWDARVGAEYAGIVEERFHRLMISWKEKGYDIDSQIIVDKDLRIIDGADRLALAIYFGLTYIKVRKVNENAITNFGIDWFEKYFDSGECKRIVEKYNLILKEMNNSKKSSEEKIREEIYLILGKNQDFGRGEFYQSLEEIGIKGQRPTEERIEIYGLKNLVRDKKVFDIGCNCGFMDIELGKYAKSVKGIEYNEDLIKIAERVKKYLGRKNVYFETGDFKKYIVQERYEVVLSFAVHQWIGLSIDEYCKKIVSMLDVGGYLVFESQNCNIDNDFSAYCHTFERFGLKRIKEGKICDDKKIQRSFLIYKN